MPAQQSQTIVVYYAAAFRCGQYAIKGRDKETDVHLRPKWEQTCLDKKD